MVRLLYIFNFRPNKTIGRLRYIHDTFYWLLRWQPFFVSAWANGKLSVNETARVTLLSRFILVLRLFLRDALLSVVSFSSRL